MKSSIIAMIAAAPLVFAPSDAFADPVTAFIAAALGGGAVATAVAGLATSLLLGAVSSALSPSNRVAPPAERLVNSAQPITYARTVYGRARVGGFLGFTKAAGDKRHYVVIVATHPIEGVVQHWIDEYTTGVRDVAGYDNANISTVQDGPEFTAPNVARTKGRIEPFYGAEGQDANSGLLSIADVLTDEHDFAGLSGAVIWAAKASDANFSEIYPQGRQWAWTPVIDGHNQIYDPRTGQYGFTQNAALILAHWLTEGVGRSVNWDRVATEADVCDEIVIDADSIGRARWQINGQISDEQSFETQRSQLAGACDAYIYEAKDGTVGFYVGRWMEPSVTIRSTDCLAVERSEVTWGGAPTEVSVRYVEPENKWREATSGAWVEVETERKNTSSPEFYCVTNHNQASRLAKRISKQSRPDAKLNLRLGLIGYELLEKRFFRFVDDELGVDDYCEVISIRRQSAWEFEVEARTVNMSDFSFDATTEEPVAPTFSSVSGSFVSPDITGLAANVGPNGSIIVSWTAQDDAYWQQVRYRLVGETDWVSVTSPDDVSQVVIAGLVDAQEYEFQARNVWSSTLAHPSEWSASVTSTPVVNPIPPLDVFAVSATPSGTQVTIAWTASNDQTHAGVRIYVGTTSDFSSVYRQFDVPGTWGVSASFVSKNLAAGDYYYWVASINQSAISGNEIGPELATVA